jgi:P27 family predicted phage terminase small subunit
MPSGLTKEQKVVWARLSRHLSKVGLLTSVDVDIMERYAVAYVRWKQCEQFIGTHGIKYPIKNKKGETTSIGQFPEVSEARSLAKALLEMAREFGLTPAARARIGITLVQNGREVKDVSEVGFTAG